MIRNLTIGHLDENGRPIRTLDRRIANQMLHQLGGRDENGLDTLGGLPVDWDGGNLVARWMVGSFRNRKAEEFAVRLHQRTGCVIAEGGRLIDPADLAKG